MGTVFIVTPQVRHPEPAVQDCWGSASGHLSPRTFIERPAWLQVTGIMLPLLKFYFHEEVRQAAVQSLPDLLRSAFLAAQKGLPGADVHYVRRMVDFIWTPLMEAMAKVGPLFVTFSQLPTSKSASGLHWLADNHVLAVSHIMLFSIYPCC